MAKPEEHKDLSPRSAGRLMVQNIPTIHENATIKEIEELMLKKAADFETINYVYIIDGTKKLLGVLSIKEVFRTKKTTRARDIMSENLITARPHTDRERVALLAIENSLKEMPVVDSENRLLGVVLNDTIIKILQEENIEDILKFAGIHNLKGSPKELLNAPVSVQYKKRLPWLIVGLVGGVIAALVVAFFESALKTQVILAAFIPAIAYMADAVGTQTQTIFIRGLSLDSKLNFLKYFIKEAKLGVNISISLSLLIGLISYGIWQTPFLSVTLVLSFMATIPVAMVVALFLPWFFTKLNIDPAIASGPFATIIRDILSLLIYFAIATFMLGYA